MVKIVKKLIKVCLSKISRRGLITWNETIQQLFTYILCGILFNIANKNVKNNKKSQCFMLTKDIYIYIYIYITENLWKTFWIKKRTKHVLKNISELQYKQKNPYNVKPRNSSQFSLLSSKKL